MNLGYRLKHGNVQIAQRLRSVERVDRDRRGSQRRGVIEDVSQDVREDLRELRQVACLEGLTAAGCSDCFQSLEGAIGCVAEIVAEADEVGDDSLVAVEITVQVSGSPHVSRQGGETALLPTTAYQIRDRGIRVVVVSGLAIREVYDVVLLATIRDRTLIMRRIGTAANS